MRFHVVQRILGLLLALFSLTLLPPMAVSLIYDDGALPPFLLAMALILAAGMVLWLPVRNLRQELRLREGFLVAVMFWAALGLSAAVPFGLSERLGMTAADAVFEAMSGLTTTGATVIVGLDDLPPSILFYRQQLQWLGGMGIIVLAVAILPMLGVGGMQLYRAETPGPMKDNKLTPRVKETAKALWYIYLGMTVACTLGYALAGMSWFDAICHSFSTVAIGGFSTYDASIGHFDSAAVELVAVAFMFLAGINFSIHFLAWRWTSIKPYLADAEFQTYITVTVSVCALTCLYLILTATYESPWESLRHGVFQAVSIGTTTGFTTTGYQQWPGFVPVLLLFASFVGGCACSTGGGLKVIRVLLLYKQGSREIRRLIHPNAVIPIKVGNKPLPNRVVDAVWGFFATYVVVFTVIMLMVMATGLDQVTAFSAVAACINNLGPGLGEVAAHYGEISAAAKWILSFAMLLGRLEIFTLLVLLTPGFWRS